MSGYKAGIDKPTGRVVVLIALLIAAAAALRGYLPVPDRVPRAEPGGGRAAMVFVVAVLSATVTLMAFAIVARLRDPRAMAPKQTDLSEMVGNRLGRPSWRVLLIGLALIVAWLLTVTLLARLWLPHAVVAPSTPAPDPSATPSPRAVAPRPSRHPSDNDTSMLGILLAATIPMLVMTVAGTVIMSRRQRAGVAGAAAADEAESSSPPTHSESLARAAERGLAAMADRSLEPREAIIACYAAMERELANVPGAVPREFDTATEVLARAVDHHALHGENAARLVDLFAEARFSPHVMNEGHREVAVRALQLVFDELGSRSSA